MKKNKNILDNISWSRINSFEDKSHNKIKDAELIKFLLSSTLSKRGLPLIVEKLLNEFGNLSDLIHADKDKLLSIKGTKESIYITFSIVRELLARSLSERIVKKM